MRRYASALPAFRSRLENRIELLPLASLAEASQLAQFYEKDARRKAKESSGGNPGNAPVVDAEELRREYEEAEARSKQLATSGVRQREFLSRLHKLAEQKLKKITPS